MTAPPWTAERSVSPELARELIARQFPELAPVRVEAPSEGWDNVAYLVNEEWIFRFPRRSIAVELIRTEAAVLPVIAPWLPLPIPLPVFVGEPEERFPWPFAGYRRLAGRTACRADLSDDQRTGAAAALGRFLRMLHTIPPEVAAQAGAGPDTMARMDVEARRGVILERLEALRTQGLLAGMGETGRWREIAESTPAGLPADGPVLVHGDLYARHVLVDDAGAPCGVIDWGDVHLGDPAVDLSLACGFLPAAARDLFRAEYGPIADPTWKKARFRALFSAVAILFYGADVGDADLVREGRAALRNLLT